MEKECVSYEQAVVLKELGFDESCFMQWHMTHTDIMFCVDEYGNPKPKTNKESHSDSGGACISAPLKQQVFRWFREYYWWYANLSSWLQEEEGTYHEYEIYDTPDSAHGSIMFKTYEEAENACIDKLILIAKQQDNGR